MTDKQLHNPIPLSDYKLFQTDDLDEARAIVAGKFCDHQLNRNSPKDQFDACHHRVEGHATSLNYIRYGADVEIDPGELGAFYLIQIPLTGAADIDNGVGEIDTGVGRGSVLNPHRHTKMRWREGCSQLLLQVDADRLNQLAERMIGRSLSAPVTFETGVDEQNASTAHWVNRLRTCFKLADSKQIFQPDTPHTQVLIEEQLIEELLCSQPSDIADLIQAKTHAISNIHVRRAVHYMRDHLSEPITMSQIAAAVGVTPRSLQLGFRSEFAQTPLQFLRKERLLQARHMLLNATSSDRVGDICEAVGFGHFGRFSTEYRRYFGESPTQTQR